MSPTSEKPTKFTIGQKREASWNKGKERGTKVMIKYLKLYLEDPIKARVYFQRKTITLNERASKAFFEFLTMELSHLFQELARQSMNHNFNLNKWITEYLAWYYEDGEYEN